MKDGEVTDMMANLRKRQGKPKKINQYGPDDSWIAGYDFGLQWFVTTKGIWIWEEKTEFRKATYGERAILQDAPMFVAMKRETNEKKTKNINEYVKGVNK